MAMASVGLASGMVVLGSFGMNLHSGLEDHPHAFMAAIGSSMAVTTGVYIGFLRWKNSARGLKEKVHAIDKVQDLLEGMGDIQDIGIIHCYISYHLLLLSLVLLIWCLPAFGWIVMSTFITDPRAKLTPPEFQSLLQRATGRQISYSQMTLLYRAFDWNKDGFLGIHSHSCMSVPRNCDYLCLGVRS
jgi:hypothetical protein